MQDEKSPLSTAALLTEIHEAMQHVASASAMGAAQMTRAVRILDGNHALSARDRMALVDAYEKVNRVATRLEAAVEKMHPRPKSLTVVADVAEEKSGRHGDITGVFALGKRVPSKWVVRGGALLLVAFFILGLVLGHYGVTAGGFVKAAAPLVAP